MPSAAASEASSIESSAVATGFTKIGRACAGQTAMTEPEGPALIGKDKVAYFLLLPVAQTQGDADAI